MRATYFSLLHRGRPLPYGKARPPSQRVVPRQKRPPFHGKRPGWRAMLPPAGQPVSIEGGCRLGRFYRDVNISVHAGEFARADRCLVGRLTRVYIPSIGPVVKARNCRRRRCPTGAQGLRQPCQLLGHPPHPPRERSSWTSREAGTAADDIGPFDPVASRPPTGSGVTVSIPVKASVWSGPERACPRRGCRPVRHRSTRACSTHPPGSSEQRFAETAADARLESSCFRNCRTSLWSGAPMSPGWASAAQTCLPGRRP